MKTFLIIGGMGSGKSTVLKVFEGFGARVIDLDIVGHEILETPVVKKELVSVFGEGIIDEDGRIVRRQLAASAFAAQGATGLLNQITEGPILKRLQDWVDECQADPLCPAVAIEASAFKGPNSVYRRFADCTIAVVAPIELRVQRAVESGFDAADVFRRISSQPTDFERQQWADFVIENDGSLEEIRSQARALWTKLTE